MRFSSRLDNFSEYVFAKLNKEVALVERITKRKVLNLGIGSPDFPPSKIYLERLKQYLDEPGSYLYPGYGAMPEFSQGLQNWYQKRFGVSIDDKELLPLPGSKEGIGNLALTLLDPDDEVLVPDPGYPAFSGTAIMLGAKPVNYDLKEETDFKIDLQELENKISPKTKCLWVNFPSNPTGQSATLNELKSVVDFARRHQIWLIYDNAYSEISFSEYVAPSILQIQGAKDIAVEIGSFSKTFSFAGFRLGWVAGNQDLISALAKVKSHLDSGLSIPLQKLGGYALQNFDKNWHENMLKNYDDRRQILKTKLKKLDLKIKDYSAGLYLWAKIPDSFRDAEEFSQQILQAKQILLTPGTAFGKNGRRFVRISICVNIDDIDSYL